MLTVRTRLDGRGGLMDVVPPPMKKNSNHATEGATVS
jgi:hypothetical protein